MTPPPSRHSMGTPTAALLPFQSPFKPTGSAFKATSTKSPITASKDSSTTKVSQRSPGLAVRAVPSTSPASGPARQSSFNAKSSNENVSPTTGQKILVRSTKKQMVSSPLLDLAA